MPEHLTFKERLRIEDLTKEGEDVVFGRVSIDLEKCKGCNFCENVCPAGAIEVKDKKAKMVDDFPFCFSCGNCTAVCPEGAITLERFIEFHKYFRYLDRGRPEPPRIF